MPESAQKVLDQLTSAGLLSPGDRPKFDQEVSVGVNALLDRLISDGRITRYQAKKFQAGQAGDIRFGDYMVLEELGRGGMGTVLLANHTRMDRKVAIKVLSPAMLDSEAAVLRFYQEVKVAAQLTHPNIVHAYDAGEHDGVHFLVMEYVQGHDLGRVQEQLGPIPLGLALDYVIQAARGLEYAHAKGVVHRDIKPSNLLLHHEGIVKILDMGLARIGGLFGDERDSHQLTMTGQMMGTVDYMSPEQAEDTRNADHRSDIYSLGCTLYRLLTNEAPFGRDTIVKTILAHRESPLPSFSEFSNSAMGPVERIIQKMVAKDPNDRYQSTTSLLHQLTRLADEIPEDQAFGIVQSADPKDPAEFGFTPARGSNAKYVESPLPATMAFQSSPAPTTAANRGSSELAPGTRSSDDVDIVIAEEVRPASRPVHQIGEPHRGKKWLILGSFAVLTAVGIVGGILGVITWIFARNDLDEMSRGLRDPAGQTLTVTGKILGMIAAAISAVTMLYSIFN